VHIIKFTALHNTRWTGCAIVHCVWDGIFNDALYDCMADFEWKWHILVHSGCYFADCSNQKLYWLLCFILVFSLPTGRGLCPFPEIFF